MGAAVDDVFRAIGDETRRAILVSLRDGERTAGDICAGFNISQPSISAHLQVLRNAGLVRVEPRGTQRLYSLNPVPLLEVAHWMDYFEKFWSHKLDRLGKALG